jgi:hypothetical protein
MRKTPADVATLMTSQSSSTTHPFLLSLSSDFFYSTLLLYLTIIFLTITMSSYSPTTATTTTIPATTKIKIVFFGVIILFQLLPPLTVLSPLTLEQQLGMRGSTTPTGTTSNTPQKTPPPPLRLPKIVFGAVFRNTKARNPIIYRRFLEMAKAITSDYHVVIYENDSKDKTRDTLLQNLGGGNSTHITLLFENNVSGAALSPKDTNSVFSSNNLHKTTRIARARNQVLHYVETHFLHYDYFAMLDMDMICTLDLVSGSYDHQILKYVLLELKDDWDVLSFRQTPYFDWWALRYPPMLPGNLLYNDLKQIDKRKGENRYGWETMEVMLARDFDNASLFPDGLIAVESAFALYTFYKMDFLRPKLARYRGVDEEGVPDCEHVAFHTDLRERLGARIRISPLTYCIPGKSFDRTKKNSTYRPLPPEIAAKMESITS